MNDDRTHRNNALCRTLGRYDLSILQTAINVPSSTIKRYQTQKRIVQCHDHRHFWFHCHILNEQNLDYVKIKSKRKINQHFSLNDFGIDSAEQTRCIKKVRKVISTRSFFHVYFSSFSTVIPCLNVEVGFWNSFDRPGKIHCLSLKDLWETKSRQW